MTVFEFTREVHGMAFKGLRFYSPVLSSKGFIKSGTFKIKVVGPVLQISNGSINFNLAINGIRSVETPMGGKLAHGVLLKLKDNTGLILANTAV